MLADHVQLCADVATGVDSIGQYQFQDLVNLDKETVGVIVRLERDHVEVLTMHGQVCIFLLDFLAINFSRFWQLLSV